MFCYQAMLMIGVHLYPDGQLYDNFASAEIELAGVAAAAGRGFPKRIGVRRSSGCSRIWSPVIDTPDSR
jgi:hypothetical protein